MLPCLLPLAAIAVASNQPSMIAADGRLRFDYGAERMILPDGLQPSLLRTKTGTLVLQSQINAKPFPSPRMHYPSALETVVSRDGGATWTPFPRPAGQNGVDLEGGMIQLREGPILALDTYVTPGSRPDEGVGQLYVSTDDWRTLQGPETAQFELPHADYYASKDDGGRPYTAERLHRRILELPNGDLLTTLYGTWEGDRTPATYEPRMIKSRVVLAGSHDQGRHWKMISTVAVDGAVGTEGFGEPVVARVSAGEHAGRLICLMRTGRNLYEADSDDGGDHFSAAHPVIFAGLDVTRTEFWVDQFRRIKGRSGRYLDENNPNELQGAVVDPDLIELRHGLLVAAFGIRIPEKAYKNDWTHPWNGNYLAVSRDHGATWSNVIRMTSGIPTTQYMAIEETLNDNELFVAYDHGIWGRKDRYTYGRTVKITEKAP